MGKTLTECLDIVEKVQDWEFLNDIGIGFIGTYDDMKVKIWESSSTENQSRDNPVHVKETYYNIRIVGQDRTYYKDACIQQYFDNVRAKVYERERVKSQEFAKNFQQWLIQKGFR